MRVWITSVLVVFGMVELYQWMKDFTLPYPVFIVSGVLLAIASNYRKYEGWSFQSPSNSSELKSVESPSGDRLSHLHSSSTKPLSLQTRSISFTIPRRTPEGVKSEES